MARVADRFARAEPRRTAAAFVEGLLSSVERKTCWSLAERAGHGDPQAMQRLLRTALWDADAVRDDVRAWLVQQLGHPEGVLITDETGFLKKGLGSVGVQRQYTGTAGRVENAQVGVFLAYVSPLGRALIDRRLYLWAWITTSLHGEHRWLLIRRNHSTGELAFYLCWSPKPVPLHTLVTVAGSRWSIEELFQTGKGQVGLDHYQVRGWTGWHRFITLAMLALAVLTVLTAASAEHADSDPEIIALTVAELRRLLNAFVLALPLPPAHTLHWSTWRRTSQARARRSHYQRRLSHHASRQVK
ncbi:DDE superfamily endonuclease [Micromonospora inositola]|uniref:DDE superfamily endonuclease n=1 Tax=Micromonospora inositola TaxID=47865 RepID=A0A1C5JB19_9ACTN|nr:DDE superfamily endonuclease [Micromonospora inositola]